MADSADLARTLLDLHRGKVTGVLTVHGPGMRTVVFFKEGQAVWAGEGAVDRTLGRMLLRDGVLDAEQYGIVIERMSEALAVGKELRFGEVAVELGFMKKAQVDEALREQVRRKITDCLACEDADIEIRESAAEVAAVPQHQLSIEALVLQGIRLHWDDARTGPLVAALASEKPRLRTDAATLASRYALALTDTALLAAMDGQRTTRVLVDGSPLGADAAARLFAALVILDAISFPATTHGAVVGRPSTPVPPPPSPKRPVAGPAKPAPPAKPAALAPPPPASGGAVRLSQLPPDVRRARLEAETQFQAGRRQFEAGKTFPAARILRRAAVLYPEAAEYALWAEWAEYKTLREAEEQAAKRVTLREAAIAALRQDKMLAMGHHVLGLVLVAENDRETALRFLRRAAELEPTNRDFRSELQRATGR